MTPLEVPLGDAPELLIEASAGTGKTYALTTLVARLLVEKRVEIGELLVVTFTIAATGELRDRIRATLRSALRRTRGEAAASDRQAVDLLERWQGCGIDRADIARRLDLALLDLDRANVMTIHGFCQRVLGDFAFEGGLPFGFEVAGDGADAVNAAFDDVWRQWAYPASPLLVRYAAKKGLAADELAGWVSGYLARLDLDIVGAGCSTEERSRELDGLEAAWRDAVRKARDTHRREAGSIPDGDRDRIAAVLQRPEVVLCTKNGSYLGNKTQGKRLRNGVPALGEALDELDQASGELRIGYDGLLPCLRRDALLGTRALLERRVREDRKLGFDDLLTGVHRALDEGKGLARSIRDRYPWALIDEYQDTDRVQAEIFRRIYRDTRLTDDDGALIIVGDPKQSIYRFRSADIFAYLNTSDAIAEDAKLRLSRNFRSVPALTEAVNAVFDHPCPFALSGIGFDPVESAIEESNLAIDGETVAEGGSTPFQIPLFPLGSRTTLDEAGHARPGRAFGSRRDRRLARPRRAGQCATAWRGVAWLGYRRTGAYGRAGPARGPCTSRTPHRQCRDRHGERHGEPRGGTAGALALGHRQTAVAAPHPWRPDGGRPRARCRRSGGAAGRRQRLEPLDRAPRRLARGVGAVGCRHVDPAHPGVRRGQGGRGPVALPGRRQAAHQPQASRGAASTDTETRERYSPTGLAAWFTRQRANAGDRDEMALLRLDSDEQLVKIVTMHAAKGLEFPIVFCPFPWDASAPRSKAWADYHRAEEGHREILDLDPSPSDLDADWLEQFSDESRLLYVALTRAKERCVVTWTKVRQTENAPFAWLLYGREAAGGEVDAGTPRVVAKLANGLSPEQWRAGLDDLATRCSAEIGIVDMDLGYRSPSIEHPANAPADLDVRQLGRELARVRQMSSYSALAHSAGAAESPGDHETVEQPDRDEDDAAEAEEEATAESARDAFNFPAGRRVGNCLHRIFERLDRGEAESVEDACRESLARYRIEAQWVDVARSMVTNTRATLLAAANGPGVGRGFRLEGLERAVPEMEFHLPLEGLDRRRLGKALADHGYENPFAGSRSNIDGFLRGFIDLVAGHDGVWYVLDYKSNWLGARADDYRPAALSKAMADHRYPLQYLLYLVALSRYLAVRLPEYDYDQHIGGAFYLFLRGIEPEAGMDRGVYFDRPSRGCIEALDACFRGAA